MADYKKYLEDQYKLAVLDFKCAKDENEQWAARRAMAKLERTAADLYGFEFADSLQTRKEAVK